MIAITLNMDWHKNTRNREFAFNFIRGIPQNRIRIKKLQWIRNPFQNNPRNKKFTIKVTKYAFFTTLFHTLLSCSKAFLMKLMVGTILSLGQLPNFSKIVNRLEIYMFLLYSVENILKWKKKMKDRNYLPSVRPSTHPRNKVFRGKERRLLERVFEALISVMYTE